jgi:hypothetical protein
MSGDSAANHKLRFSLFPFIKSFPRKNDEGSIENRMQCVNSIGSNRKLCIPREVTYCFIFSNQGVITASE